MIRVGFFYCQNVILDPPLFSFYTQLSINTICECLVVTLMTGPHSLPVEKYFLSSHKFLFHTFTSVIQKKSVFIYVKALRQHSSCAGGEIVICLSSTLHMNKA